MTREVAFALALAAPILQIALSPLRPRGLREALHVALGAVSAGLLWWLFARSLEAGAEPVVLTLAEPIPGARLAFSGDPLSLFFAAVAASVACLISAHAAAFLALEREGPARDAAMRALAAVTGASVALVAAGALFTATLAASLLAIGGGAAIARRGDPAAARAASTHFAAWLCAALGVLAAASAWVHGLAGQTAFVQGGLLATAPADALGPLMALFVLGLAGPSLPPLHRGLAGAALADAPLAGAVFAISAAAAMASLVKVAAFVFGPTLATIGPLREALIAVAHLGAVASSVLALARPGLKERLAYLSIAQLGLIAAGALTPNAASGFGAALHLVTFAAGAATLFMAAGAAEAVAGRRAVAELAGLGRVMPFTFAAFAVGALAFAGVAPLAGAWSRLWLAAGAAEAGDVWATLSVLATGALAFAALAPAAARALFAPAPSLTRLRPDAGTAALVAPIAAAAALLVGLVLAVEPAARALGPELQAAYLGQEIAP